MTINLKLVVLLMVTVATINVNAQKKAPQKTTKPATETQTAKPTKQETMDWIAGKMKEHLVSPREFVSYANGEFKYSKVVGVYSCTTTIYLNKITGSSSEYSSSYFVKGTGMIFIDCGKEYQHKNESQDALSIGGSNYNEYSDPFDIKADDALLERMKKAMATLIEYNSTQKRADEKF